MPNIYIELLKQYCDGLISLQDKSEDRAFRCGIYCRSCKNIHGRCPDAVYGFVVAAKVFGDDIVTGTINACLSFPRVKTCTELTEKVVSLAPSVLRFNRMNAVTVEFGDSSEFTKDEIEKFSLPYGKCEETDLMRASLFTLEENTLQKKVGSVTAIVGCKEGFEISAGEEKTLSVKVLNNVKAYGNLPHTVRIKLWLPEGFSADKTEIDIFAPTGRRLLWTVFRMKSK